VDSHGNGEYFSAPRECYQSDMCFLSVGALLVGGDGGTELLLGVGGDTWDVAPRFRPALTGSSPAGELGGSIGFMTPAFRDTNFPAPRAYSGALCREGPDIWSSPKFSKGGCQTENC